MALAAPAFNNQSQMSTSYRVFVVHDDHTVEPLSQKAFNQFYFRNEPSLMRFAGRSICVAMVFCELKNRKPERIVRVDTQRVVVTAEGAIDQERSDDATRLAISRMERLHPSQAADARAPGPVIDASAKFDERRWAHYYPQLSGSALWNVHRALFSSAGAR